eukprot:Rhum_TRINITY_DN11080_c0_g1::Rhum_TRINITY_DN11080_c0_g1_i1::g.42285::m.42285/K16749/BBS7; Bardet-Biedl syndrome 7 protein
MMQSQGMPITSLTRVDLSLVSGSNRKCMAVLPKTSGKAKKQKIVVGDTSGVLRWLSAGKSGEMECTYKVSTPDARPYSAVSIDGDEGNKRVFAAGGDMVWGYKESKKDLTRNEKPFFTLETNLTEPIRHMAVNAPFIWTGGEYVIASFDNGGEVAYLNGTDIVNDLVLTKSLGDGLQAIVACQDRTIKVINQKQFAHHEQCEGGVLSLHEVCWAQQAKQVSTLKSVKKSKKEQSNEGGHKMNTELLYGTANGYIGSYKLTPSGMSKQWSSGGTAETKGGVAALLANDTLSAGVPQIVVGRDDGNIEVHGFEVGTTGPQVAFRSAGSESVQSVSSGCVLQSDREDIVVATYTGKVVAFAHDSAEDIPSWSQTGTASMSEARAKEISVGNAEKKKKLNTLTEDIEKMKTKLLEKKAEYQKVSTNMVPVTAQHNVKDKFVLEGGACWSLSIEIDGPIDTVAIQSDVDLELLDTEANACIVSTTKPEPEEASKLLACYRCTETTSRIQVKVRTVEGQHGFLRAFVIPVLTPKTCQMVQYDIKPLSLHQRLSEKPALMLASPVSMKMDGDFSVTDMHAWVHSCLPEVPQSLQKDKGMLYFVSTLLGTQLAIEYRNGEAAFHSDNISTLVILSEHIGKAATQSKKKLHVATDTEKLTDCCVKVLRCISPKLEYQLSLSDKIAMMECLKELEMQEQDVSFLSDTYQSVLKSSAAIEKEHAQQPRQLEFLNGLVKKLFLDKATLKGQAAAHKIPALMQLLQHGRYNLKDLLEFFKNA